MSSLRCASIERDFLDFLQERHDAMQLIPWRPLFVEIAMRQDEQAKRNASQLAEARALAEELLRRPRQRLTLPGEVQ